MFNFFLNFDKSDNLSCVSKDIAIALTPSETACKISSLISLLTINYIASSMNLIFVSLHNQF
jgi:hypothetical protein